LKVKWSRTLTALFSKTRDTSKTLSGTHEGFSWVYQYEGGINEWKPKGEN
jgi:hypothetical protein